MTKTKAIALALAASLLIGIAAGPSSAQEVRDLTGSTFYQAAKASTSSHFNYRFSKGILQRKGNRDNSWTSKPAKPLSVNSVRARAFANLKAANSGAMDAKVEYRIGANVPKSMLDAYRLQIKQSIQYFNFSGLREPIDVVIFTEKDLQVVREYWSKRHWADETIERLTESVADYKTSPLNRSVGGGAGARYELDGSYPTIGIDFHMSSKHSMEKSLLVEHVPHEMAHVWQNHAMNTPDKLHNQIPFDFANYIPCHAIEGGANILGLAVAVRYNDWYAEAADVIIRRTAKESKITKMTNQLAVTLLNKTEDYGTCSEGYSIGMLAFEWMVAKYGAQAFFDVYYKVGEKRPFEDVILEITGLTKDQFYAAAAPHITSSFNNALKKK